MATLSSSWKPNLPLAHRSRSPVHNRAPSPTSRPSSPSPQAGETATTIAWRNALNSYRKSLSDKDFKRITIPAEPEDVASEVEKWMCRQSASKYDRVAAAVRAGVGRMQRFSASIDMLAQGSPSPGCLLWGSIKFVLTVGVSFRSHQQKMDKSSLDPSFPNPTVHLPFQYALFLRDRIEMSWMMLMIFLKSLIDRARCCRRI